MSYDFASYNAPQSAVLDTLSINTDYLGGLMESHGPAHRAGQRRNGLAMYPAPYVYPTFSGLTSTTHAVFSVEKSLAHTETMTFNLAAAPCVSRTGGVTATADFEYDLLITTASNKKLLAGSYSDTIELILTDI